MHTKRTVPEKDAAGAPDSRRTNVPGSHPAPEEAPPAIEVKELTKRFGATEAVRGISLTVAAGEILGLLGPNGAGKTTTIKMLLALYPPTSGQARVAGCDVVTDTDAVRREIGWVPQEPALDPLLTGRENLLMQAGMYHLPPDQSRLRTEELLELVELTQAADRIVRTYSGGMKKRLDLAMGLVHRPRVLFLDEPTLGLDIQARHRLWQYIRTFRDMGTTLLLTTHYLDEADALCDRIAIIDEGKIRALAPPDELKARFGTESIRLVLGPVTDASRAALERDLEGRPEVVVASRTSTGYRLAVTNHAAAVPAVLDLVQAHGVPLLSVVCERPSLDDVFLQVTGYSLRERVEER